MDHFYYPHTVSQGETLTSIADTWGWKSPQALIQFRPNRGILNPNRIIPGQAIAIPYKKESMLRWRDHYTEAMRQATHAMDEYNSAGNQLYRSVREAFDTVEGWFDSLMDTKTAWNAGKLLNQLEHMHGKVLKMAQVLLLIRTANTAIFGLDKFIESVQFLNTKIEEAKHGLKNTQNKKNMEELHRFAKAVLRHCEIGLEVYEGFFRKQGIAKASLNRKTLYGPGNEPDKAVFQALKGLAGQTVDHVFLAGKVGFYLGDTLATIAGKGDWQLFFYGFSEYDEMVRKQLEKSMLKNVEVAQLALSRIHLQLNSGVYQYA